MSKRKPNAKLRKALKTARKAARKNVAKLKSAKPLYTQLPEPKRDEPRICQECNMEMTLGAGFEGDDFVEYYHCDGCGWSEDV